jgi:hypothetical protein
MADSVAKPTKRERMSAALCRFMHRRITALSYFIHGQGIYFAHVIGLISPGEEMPVFRSHQIESAPLDNWTDDDLERMIDEGQRQLDRQLCDLERIRARAQWLLTTGAAITAAVGAALITKRPSGEVLLLWVPALVLLGCGVAGAAAVMTVRADFKTIDTAVLSTKAPPILRTLATSYSRMLRTGENTVATRLTVFRQAVLYVIIGGYFGLLAALISH